MDFCTLLLGHPVWMWALFGLVIVTILFLDLGVFHKKDHVMGLAESLKLSSFYVFLACLFGGWVSWSLGGVAGGNFFTGYLVEYTLSMDNIFVISLIFAYLGIPREHQHRVLFWGIIGVIVLRGAMIFAGAALLARFEWILYGFGIFLIYSGVKMFAIADKDDHMDVSNSPVLKFLRKHFRISQKLYDQRFFVRLADKDGHEHLNLTPLMVSLILIELADVVFAVDSVPAIFGITRDAYVVFTSNLFAVLGLRSLYFALSALVAKFSYLKKALSVVLIFIGGKILLPPLLGLHLPSWVSLVVTVLILGWGVGWSIYRIKCPKRV